ncbi:MAG TPA: pyridoxamine 5'-phosphate oxidase family protein [Acidimicrobiales bacterium]|nr:pyridoxamine 5'-phosphate oxidase family protein [Acidimicrobiales bacterium]
MTPRLTAVPEAAPAALATTDDGVATIGAAVVVERDRSGLLVLTRAECLRLLATTTLGRVGITIGALPAITPVNFRLVDQSIVFRTGVGTRLEAATRDAVVAFEADRVDSLTGEGWSVTVTGTARQTDDPDELAALGRLHIPRWTEWGDDRFVVVSTDIITGRRSPHLS